MGVGHLLLDGVYEDLERVFRLLAADLLSEGGKDYDTLGEALLEESDGLCCLVEKGIVLDGALLPGVGAFLLGLFE